VEFGAGSTAEIIDDLQALGAELEAQRRAAAAYTAEVDALRDEVAERTASLAAALVREHGRHPEREIDSVTTPRGCTIAGLNEMEHRGFSSALIKGITTSSLKAESLYSAD